jgi:hypothetical protein
MWLPDAGENPASASRRRTCASAFHAGVHDQHLHLARGAEHQRDRLYRAGKLRDIVAQRFAEAAVLQKSRCMSMIRSVVVDQSRSIGIAASSSP